MDVSSLGWQFFHNAQIHKAYSLAFAAEDMGLAGFPAHGNTLIGHKHFDDSDYTFIVAKIGCLRLKWLLAG